MRTTLILFALASLTNPARAAVPGAFSVEGVLRDAGGKLQSMMVDVTVTLWDAQSGGGTVAGPYGPTTVMAQNGLFSAPVTDPNLANWLGNASDVWLEVKVGADVFSRQHVTSQLFAARCDTAEHLAGVLPISSGGTGSTTQNFVDLSSNQSIGGTKSFSGAIVVGGNIQVGASGPISQNWWEFGLDDGATGTGIDFHGGSTLTDFTARFYRLAGDNGDFHIQNQGSGTIHISNGGAARVSIAANGNVGINNTAPAFALDVTGPTRLSGISYFLKGGNNGTATCTTFCRGSGWPGGVGECVGGKDVGAGTYIGCGTTLGAIGNVVCLCAGF